VYSWFCTSSPWREPSMGKYTTPSLCMPHCCACSSAVLPASGLNAGPAEIGVTPSHQDSGGVALRHDNGIRGRHRDAGKTEFRLAAVRLDRQRPEQRADPSERRGRMGAGVLDCDVTFTRDGQLVCRHDQCDLHTTTNVRATDLAQKYSVPFSPAVFDPATGARTRPASALCCTSDLTLAELKSLTGKMDASNPSATRPREFLGGTANWRTDLYSTGGTLLSTPLSSTTCTRFAGAGAPTVASEPIFMRAAPAPSSTTTGLPVKPLRLRAGRGDGTAVLGITAFGLSSPRGIGCGAGEWARYRRGYTSAQRAARDCMGNSRMRGACRVKFSRCSSSRWPSWDS
jgi:hypothetical protein